MDGEKDLGPVSSDRPADSHVLASYPQPCKARRVRYWLLTSMWRSKGFTWAESKGHVRAMPGTVANVLSTVPHPRHIAVVSVSSAGYDDRNPS